MQPFKASANETRFSNSQKSTQEKGHRMGFLRPLTWDLSSIEALPGQERGIYSLQLGLCSTSDRWVLEQRVGALSAGDVDLTQADDIKPTAPTHTPSRKRETSPRKKINHTVTSPKITPSVICS